MSPLWTESEETEGFKRTGRIARNGRIWLERFKCEACGIDVERIMDLRQQVYGDQGPAPCLAPAQGEPDRPCPEQVYGKPPSTRPSPVPAPCLTPAQGDLDRPCLERVYGDPSSTRPSPCLVHPCPDLPAGLSGARPRSRPSKSVTGGIRAKINKVALHMLKGIAIMAVPRYFVCLLFKVSFQTCTLAWNLDNWRIGHLEGSSQCTIEFVSNLVLPYWTSRSYNGVILVMLLMLLDKVRPRLAQMILKIEKKKKTSLDNDISWKDQWLVNVNHHWDI